ncbi:RHS repeat-associated core domain-containing protein [Gemmatimonadota bacterium]
MSEIKTQLLSISLGTFDLTLVYNSGDTLVAKTEYNLADDAILYRAYDHVRSVVYEPHLGGGFDSLAVQTWTTYSVYNGLPDHIREEVSPFEPRGFTIDETPSSKHEFYRTRHIAYAAGGISGMDEDHTHQLAAISMETIREEVKEEGSTWKTAPISVSKTGWTQHGSSYYRPSAFIIWTGSNAEGDTTITWASAEVDTIRQIVSSDDYGHITEEKDGEGRITRYYYGDNSSNLSNTATDLQNRFLTGVSQVSGSDSLTSKTDWNGDVGLVTDVEDANGITTYTEYDDYFRPYKTKNDTSHTLTEISYSFARDQSGNDSFDATKPNYVRAMAFFTIDGSTDTTFSTVFSDGWGRTLQTHQRNGSNDIVSALDYNSDGVLRLTYAPYDTSNADHSFEDPTSFGVQDTTNYEYQNDPRRRPIKATYPTMDDAPTRPYTTVSYGLELITSGPAYDHWYFTTSVTDENGVVHESWTGPSGGVLKTTVGGSYAAEAWSNVLGQASLILPPETSGSRTSELKTEVTMSPFGREIERDEPDQNTTKTVYDRSLRPIWVQEAADAAGDSFWATSYDGFGRVINIGKEKDQSASWYTMVPTTPVSSYGTEVDEWRKKYDYDSDYVGSGTTYSEGRLTRVLGNYDYDTSSEYYEYYQYSLEGWITKQRQSISGAITRDIDYEYDTGGRLRKVSFADAESSDEFFIWYDYDSAGRLYQIYSHTSDSKPGTATAEYAYNARGQVTQQKLGSTVQQVDYTYNARGLLTHINDPANLDTDLFAMELGYDAKVTSGPSTGWSAENNGNISQIKWVNKGYNDDDTVYYYTFGYDSRNQLTQADCSNNSWDVSSYSYDNNGNFSGLNRGSAWTYNYDGDEDDTNRLDDISGRTSDDNWDYDLNGRQTVADTCGSMTGATYHFPGAAFHDITMSSGTLQMRYNAQNRRLQKTVVSGTTLNYVRDIGGQVMAVYDGTTIIERYVWGPMGLVSIVKGTNSGTRYYTLTDHLGSVRSVVSTGGSAVAGYDYYPFGESIRSEFTGNTYSRFMFQGKEFDDELNLNLYYFEARFYNPEIGRFASPDPVRQGWSYYSFSGNNPIRFIDPTGLSAEESGEGDYQPPTHRDGRDYDTGSSYAYGGCILFLDASGASMGDSYNNHHNSWLVLLC